MVFTDLAVEAETVARSFVEKIEAVRPRMTSRSKAGLTRVRLRVRHVLRILGEGIGQTVNPLFSYIRIFSLDEKMAQATVDEIKAAGGDAIAVGGDVGAESFPEKILKATIE